MTNELLDQPANPYLMVIFGKENGHWRRVIIEKLFGHDLKSARALHKNISTVLKECCTC